MPSPVAHGLAGTSIHFLGRGVNLRRQWASLLFIVFVANFADMDFLPGYFVGDPRAYHWGPTHSLVAALFLGAIAGIIGRVLFGSYRAAITMAILAYGSHLLLDSLLGRSGFPLGLELFWPFSAQRFMLPWELFRMAPDSIRLGPVAALLDVQIIPVIERELWIMLPVTAVAWFVGMLRNGKRDVS
jgi:membrane-bound metal-dependent hydrolase YbcI (DUF457 family)